MKKVILSVIAMVFSAQMAFANDLDDLDDIQQAIGSAVGETTASVVAGASGAIATTVNTATAAGATGANIAGAAGAGANIAANTGTGVNAANTGTAAVGTGAGVATAQQLVALSPTQLAALGIQANPLTATSNNTALVPATANISLTASATNINGVFAAIPTASGNVSAASIAATSAAMEIADSNDFSYDDE